MAEKKKTEKKTNKILIIVESPAKTKSLTKFLGKKYLVKSSVGHLIDLPKSTMGVDVENDFEPRYITIRGKGKTLADLKRAAKGSSEILLATDPDREGEAISWHLERVLSNGKTQIKRIEFHEITKDAVINAIKHPRDIDILRVNSQQARRILDRIVGYSISPLLQEKLGSKRFSAGRVQSAALKIICEREKQIEEFKAKEYWEVDGFFKNENSSIKDTACPFRLVQINKKKTEISSAEEAKKIEDNLKNTLFTVSMRKISDRNIKPIPPYVTSKMQQDASTRLGFRAGKTMSIAQSLYEGVEEYGGLITYMRTDSTRISETGIAMARNYIAENFEKGYLPEKANFYSSKKGAQDAHEAIRPTDVGRTPEKMAAFLSKDQLKLYTLIWSRFIASQMSIGIDELVTIEITAKNKDDEYLFRFSSSRQKFKGFRAIYSFGASKEEYIPKFQQNDSIILNNIEKEQKFTQPPARFTEASLIKIMEESGIGRPATYVPTIFTLEKRSYVERKGRQFIPTKLGMVINDQIKEYFPEIVNLEFTARMEEKLDSVASGNINWRDILKDFYGPLKRDIKKASEAMTDLSHLIRTPINKKCPECGFELLKKLGKNGYFIGCENFVGGCRYTESIAMGECPLCKGKVIRKASKKGRAFYGCENYITENCTFIMTDKPSEKKCPKCSSIMGERVKKSGIILNCQNAECKYMVEEKSDDG
ncbi:MAG: type I DNA topoisomerase [Spirochaetia bacterium]|nr:type I DNA topoisomerase [Spirochaetia bacterium]